MVDGNAIIEAAGGWDPSLESTGIVKKGGGYAVTEAVGPGALMAVGEGRASTGVAELGDGVSGIRGGGNEICGGGAAADSTARGGG